MVKNKQTRIAASYILSFFLSSCLFAGVNAWQPIVTFTGGVALSTLGSDHQYFSPQNGLYSFYNYNLSKSKHAQAYLGGFIGAEQLLKTKWLMQIGVGYYQPSNVTVHGYVTQGVEVNSANQYAWQYAIQSHQMLAEAKVLYNNWKRIHPYLSSGLGVTWNNSQSFHVTILPVFTAFSNQFVNHTTTSFSYNVGLGIDVDMTTSSRIGIGYRFTDFGHAATGSSMIDDVATTYSLSQPHLYVQALIAQVTFDFM